MTEFDDEWLAVALIICLPSYCILVAMGLWIYSGYESDSNGNEEDIEEMADSVKGSIDVYKNATQNYKSKSKMKLMEYYSEMKRESKEDMERLALEDELVERGMIDESQMRRKAQNIKDKMFNGD